MFFLITIGQMPCGSDQQANPLITFMPLIFIFIIFYFLLIKPQQKRQKEIQEMLANLQKGDKVITTGGIHGIIANIKEDVVTLKVAENVKIDVSRNCIATVKREKVEST